MNDAALMLSAGFRIDAEPFLKSTLVCLRAHLLHVRSLPIVAELPLFS